MKIAAVGPERMGTCPAAVQIEANGDATLVVNSLTFGTSPEWAQRFYVAHELGHWLLDTGSEHLADAFALGLLAGTGRRSLMRSLEALNRLHTIPYSRLEALYTVARQLDRKHR